MNFEKKYELVKLAMSRAYTPYSNFKVGAMLLFSDDSYVLGCNVENASYGITNCAERTAMFSAIAMGLDTHKVVEILIIADAPRAVSPCGACRQVMCELLNRDCKVTLLNLGDDKVETTVEALMPYCFEKSDMDAK